MFIIKENYYLYIQNLKDIDVSALKVANKFNIILRHPKNNEINKIINFRKKCKYKRIKFYIANNSTIAQKCKADGLYISSYNKKKYYLNIRKIGSAHNLREINEKIKQKCDIILFSRLFKTNYVNKKSFYGVVKFNLITKNFITKIIPLGGIRISNILKLNMIKSRGFAFLSEAKKKPAFLSRLF